MSVYTVHEPPLRAAEMSPDPERFVFVRDGFYFWAFLLTPLWMLWHRLWLVLLIYVVVMFGIENAMHYAGIGVAAGYPVAALISLLVGMEAGTLRRWTLAQRGFRQVGIVGGSNAEAAERRFFDAWVGAAAAKPSEPTTGAAPPPMPHMPPAPDIIGLFPEPGASR
jgi:Protein of unknown function (DUF2628)